MNATEKDKSNQSEAARLYERSSEKNRNLFLFYLVVIAYILIIVASTTDLDLLLPENFITLPVLSAGIPLTYFYVLSSPLVLMLHFNFLHNTTEHQKKIKQWENGKSMPSHRMQMYIFDFAYRSPPGIWGNILVRSTNFLFYFLAPACLFCIQWRFSDYQNLWFSFLHLICLWADLYLLILFFNQTHNSSEDRNLSSKKQDSSDSKGVAAFLIFFKSIGKLLKASVITLIKDIGKLCKEDGKRLSVIILFFFVSFANFWIVGMLQFERSITWLEKPHEFTRSIAMPIKLTTLSNFTIPIGKLLNNFIAPKITIPPGTRIQKQSLEELKFMAIQSDTNETDAWKNHGENYDLRGRRLVFADLSNSDMQKIVLIGAHLQGSNMSMVQMQDAKMRGAQLQGANMWKAQLQGADMWGAQLQGANMGRAQLQDADMWEAQLLGANMRDSQLQGADMRRADMFRAQLQGANMWKAQLQGAYMLRAQLQGAYMLRAQLQGAYMFRAQLQGAYMFRAQLQDADMFRAQLQGADMSRAQLQGADMFRAQLQGADMSRAQLQGADMSGAQLQGADMSRAQLQGADMSRAQLQGADMREAQLQGADMSSAQLQGANIREAKFSGTYIEKANLRGSFCKEETYDSFFDRINARIGGGGLEGCDAIDSQFGPLTQDTADSIIESLRSNGNVFEETTDKIEKNIYEKVGEMPSMVEVEKRVLDLEEVCEIIKNWQEGVKNTPKLKDIYVSWRDTEANQKSRLLGCPTASKI